MTKCHRLLISALAVIASDTALLACAADAVSPVTSLDHTQADESNVQVNRLNESANDAGGEERVPNFLLPFIERFGVDWKKVQNRIARIGEESAWSKYKGAWRKENKASEEEVTSITGLDDRWKKNEEDLAKFLALHKKADEAVKAEESKWLQAKAIWDREQAAWRTKKTIWQRLFSTKKPVKWDPTALAERRAAMDKVVDAHDEKQEVLRQKARWTDQEKQSVHELSHLQKQVAEEEVKQNLARFTTLKEDDVTVDKYGELLDLDPSTVKSYVRGKISPQDFSRMGPEYRRFLYYEKFYEKGSEGVDNFIALMHRPSEWW
ncbi:unnamed protein product [Hyaloperonospora brassicae]|uniref:RxLR effector protein n=1 Tax=Hyaloperonospora brassicae TaxID=162125 RepID=A0AAV0ULW6_HYABA|nr:unnamed protein product [Hyaloperonospora brassicae]